MPLHRLPIARSPRFLKTCSSRRTCPSVSPRCLVNAALIAAAQRVEHYEIASYGCLITYADLLDNREAVRLLEQTLAEEEAADEALTTLGERGINQAALAAGQDEDQE